MAVHESSVNYRNLIRDLAEMYPHDVAEVVVVELIANALDAGATRISVDFDPQRKVLLVQDDGAGMSASQFDGYHDFAAGLKTRGDVIGFAGVGAKISFNIAAQVITETRSGTFAGASKWYLESNKRLIWDDIEPIHLQGTGTRVEVQFNPNSRVPYSSTNDLASLIRRHYMPLLDPRFLVLYDTLGFYSRELRFVVNGQFVLPEAVDIGLSLEKVREFFPTKGGRRIGYGILGLASAEYPLGPDRCGVLLCTRGKVIKADLFNQFPGDLGPRILGVVEIPEFVNFLTTAKTDFIRGQRHRQFESLYSPVREEFKSWLATLGVQLTEIAGTDEAAQLQRELRKIVEDVPELGEFFGFRARRSVLQNSETGPLTATWEEGVALTLPVGEGEGGEGPGPLGPGEDAGQTLVADPDGGATRATPITRTARRGPRIGLDNRPDRIELAWIDGNNVFINSGHPAYLKTPLSSAARRHHCLFAIATGVQRFLSTEEPSADMTFIDRMMGAWGKK